MKIVKIQPLGEDLIEIEFDNGMKSQMKPSELETGPESPMDFKSEVKKIYAQDIGRGGEESGRGTG